MKRMLFFILCFFCLKLSAELYEGSPSFIYRSRIELDWLEKILPPDPIIFEAGAYFGNETVRLAQKWPSARVIAFEPNPVAFEMLLKAMKDAHVENGEAYCLALNDYPGNAILHLYRGPTGIDTVYEYASSLLTLPYFYPKIELIVPCVILDRWCKRQNIDHIDLLKLELEGMELAVLKSSPQILSTVKVIYLKTFINPHRVGMTGYMELKKYLDDQGFSLLAHWFYPDIEGYAIFIKKELYNAAI